MYEKSKKFFKDFSEIFSEGSETRKQAIKDYQNNSLFTDFIISEINKIIKNSGYRYQNEYFRIDASGYNPRWTELSRKSNLNQHLWDLEIAIEHENDYKDWLDEVIKLAHVCCPLRVIIGYIPVEEREKDLDYLEYAANALKMLKCKNNVLTGEFMVIFGNCKTKYEKDYFNYKAYVLNPKSFKFDPLNI